MERAARLFPNGRRGMLGARGVVAAETPGRSLERHGQSGARRARATKAGVFLCAVGPFWSGSSPRSAAVCFRLRLYDEDSEEDREGKDRTKLQPSSSTLPIEGCLLRREADCRVCCGNCARGGSCSSAPRRVGQSPALPLILLVRRLSCRASSSRSSGATSISRPGRSSRTSFRSSPDAGASAAGPPRILPGFEWSRGLLSGAGFGNTGFEASTVFSVTKLFSVNQTDEALGSGSI